MTCALAVLGGVAGACAPRDISREPLFVDMVGRQYRIIGDVYAYGIKAELADKEASFISLVPRAVTGPEVAFQRRLPIGQVFRIRAVRRQFVLFEKGIEYLIDLQNSDLPRGIEIRLELLRGNESGDVDLNPRLYERIADNK
jgi:hypothetical protein